MARKKKEIVVSTARPERKKVVPKTAFKKGQPNPHAFKPGESGRTRRKKSEEQQPDDARLVSRALRVSLAHRAPDERARMVGLKPGASWAQIVAQALMLKASEGDVSAAREVREGSEGGRNFGIGVGIQFGGDAGEVGSEQTPMLRVIFTSSEYRELAKESGLSTDLAVSTEPPVLDGKALAQSDEDPTLAAARAEAQRAAAARAEAAEEEDETEAAADGEPESEAATVNTKQQQPEPTLPQGYVGWPKWKILQYRGQGWRIPSNVVEV